MSGQLMYRKPLEIIELGPTKPETSGLQPLYRSKIDKMISSTLKNLKKEEIIPSKNYGADETDPVYGVSGRCNGDGYYISRFGPNNRDIIVDIIPKDNGAEVLCKNNIYSMVAGSKKEAVKKAAKKIAKEYGLIVKECEYGMNVFAARYIAPAEALEKSICDVFKAQNDLVETILKG